jgi:hypothetical protein
VRKAGNATRVEFVFTPVRTISLFTNSTLLVD